MWPEIYGEAVWVMISCQCCQFKYKDKWQCQDEQAIIYLNIWVVKVSEKSLLIKGKLFQRLY